MTRNPDGGSSNLGAALLFWCAWFFGGVQVWSAAVSAVSLTFANSGAPATHAMTTPMYLVIAVGVSALGGWLGGRAALGPTLRCEPWWLPPTAATVLWAGLGSLVASVYGQDTAYREILLFLPWILVPGLLGQSVVMRGVAKGTQTVNPIT